MRQTFRLCVRKPSWILPWTCSSTTLAYFSTVNSCYKFFKVQSWQNRGTNRHLGPGAQRPDSLRDKETRFPLHKSWLMSIHSNLLRSVALPPIRQGLTDYSATFLKSLSTAELMSEARNIQRVDRDTMGIIVALWKRLDSMTVEEMITTSDIFLMNSVSTPWYNSALISHITEMFDLLHMSPEQCVRFSLHVSNHGYSPPHLQLMLEQQLSDTLDQFDMNQVCIICHSFFLSKAKIRSAVLLDKIAQKLLQEFNEVYKWYVPNLLKTLRLSNYVKVSFYKELGDLILKNDYFSSFRNTGQIMHFAFTYASVRVTHPELFEYILTQCLNPHLDWRVKDMSKVIWACGTLVTDSAKHMEAIGNIVSGEYFQTEAIRKYPDNLAECMVGLSLLNIYPHDLLDQLFDPRVIDTLKGFGVDREKFSQLHFLDHCISIECPDYMGNRLSQADQSFVSDQLKQFTVETDTERRKSVKPVMLALQNVLGEDAVTSTFVLPHFKTTDILLIYDRDRREFCHLSEENAIDWSSPRKSTDNWQRIVILLLSRAQTSYDEKPLGMMHCKHRQLQRLGYEVITVDASEALNFTVMDEEQIQRALLPKIYARTSELTSAL